MGTDIKRDVTSEKEMEKKYYTPEIEELRELRTTYEYRYDHSNASKDWEEIEEDDYYDRLLSDHIELKVKHLDREDIESLGWEFIKEYKEPGSYYLVFKKGHTELTLHPALEETTLFIEHESATGINSTGYPIFRGQIKNKSELKKLLKQLGI